MVCFWGAIGSQTWWVSGPMEWGNVCLHRWLVQGRLGICRISRLCVQHQLSKNMRKVSGCNLHGLTNPTACRPRQVLRLVELVVLVCITYLRTSWNQGRKSHLKNLFVSPWFINQIGRTQYTNACTWSNLWLSRQDPGARPDHVHSINTRSYYEIIMWFHGIT